MHTDEYPIEQIDKILDALTEFMQNFELVFGDDWEHTLASINADPSVFIKQDGSFLSPQVSDESSDWFSRGNLLTSYRYLVALMKSVGIYKSYDTK